MVKIDITVNELKDAVEKYVCDTTTIIIMNGLDILELNMENFPKSCFFISDMCVERGKAYEVTEKELKLKLFDFCTNNKDRCFQGTGGNNGTRND